MKSLYRLQTKGGPWEPPGVLAVCTSLVTALEIGIKLLDNPDPRDNYSDEGLEIEEFEANKYTFEVLSKVLDEDFKDVLQTLKDFYI